MIRDASHGPGGLTNIMCYPRLITDFVVNGTAVGLDTSCTKEMKRPAFLVKEEEKKDEQGG